MSHDSAVEFPTNTRIHVGLAVKNLENAVAFYRTLFGQDPSKTRPGYAKFEVADPPVNLSLNEAGGETRPGNPVSHFGIQVKTSAAVRPAAGRLQDAGLETKVEENVTCCYAVQDKVWAADPDGNRWEVFVVLDNAGTCHASSCGGCCETGSCSSCCEAATCSTCCPETCPCSAGRCDTAACSTCC